MRGKTARWGLPEQAVREVTAQEGHRPELRSGSGRREALGQAHGPPPICPHPPDCASLEPERGTCPAC